MLNQPFLILNQGHSHPLYEMKEHHHNNDKRKAKTHVGKGCNDKGRKVLDGGGRRHAPSNRKAGDSHETNDENHVYSDVDCDPGFPSFPKFLQRKK